MYDPLRRMSGFFNRSECLGAFPYHRISCKRNYNDFCLDDTGADRYFNIGHLRSDRERSEESNLLLPVEADFAQSIENHEMSLHGAVRKMRSVVGGIEIPAKDSVEFK